jgi:hypothetical protein
MPQTLGNVAFLTLKLRLIERSVDDFAGLAAKE